MIDIFDLIIKELYKGAFNHNQYFSLNSETNTDLCIDHFCSKIISKNTEICDRCISSLVHIELA